MDARISTLESDVAAIRANVEAVLPTYATNHLLVAAEGRLELTIEQSKNELQLNIDQAKYELDLKIERAKNELDLKMEHLASELRLDLKSLSAKLRSWFLGTAITMFVAFGSITVAMYNALKP